MVSQLNLILMKNANCYDMTARGVALNKAEFFEAARKIPFLYDAMRYESLWAEKCEEQHGLKPMGSGGNSSNNLNVLLPVQDKILIFRFENNIMNKP